MRGLDHYRDLIRLCPAAPLKGNAFRVIPGSAIVNKIPFDRLFFGKSAGRCNPRGVARLYASLDKETALAEFEYYERKAGLDPTLSESFHYPLAVDLASVLDLSDSDNRDKLGLSDTDMRETYIDGAVPPLTSLQLVGIAVAGGLGNLTAIRFPSVRNPTGSNIVIFRDVLKKGTDCVASAANPALRLP